MTRVAIAHPERAPLDVALSAIPSVPRPMLARMTERALSRLIVCSDGEDEGTIILPAPKGVEPTRWRVT
ncbi:MAG: hypothetical protein KAF42_02005 [Sphingopyxis terrae]|nr:hypothetical protein [Sphingopyxis terrae]